MSDAATTQRDEKISFMWNNRETVEATRQSGQKPCRQCKADGVPGLVLNAGQWVRCFGCNTGQKGARQ